MTPWFDYPEFHWPDKHATVIGAGIAGCQMTWHLSRLGWRVTLIEQESKISQKASGNLAGVISPKMTAQPSDGERFYGSAFDYTTTQLRHLAQGQANQQTRLQWSACGMLQLAHNARELQRWEALKSRGLPESFIQLVDSETASELAGFSCHFPASYFPDAGFINPASFCHSLLDGSQYQLISVKTVQRIKSINEAEPEWQLLGENDEPISQSPVVIVCGGSQLDRFDQTSVIPQSPVLGQTTLAPEITDFETHCVVGHEGYFTPTFQGQHVFGATFDRHYSQESLSDAADQRNLEQLTQYVPILGEKINKVESGHAATRATTPDRYPYTGGLPNAGFYREAYSDLKHGRKQQRFPTANYQHGLFVLGGLGSRGLTTAAYCANLLSKLIDNQPRSQQEHALLNTLHPARFLVKQLKRGNV